ncbi:hypothetical protein FIV06_30445 (plasmid) [Labrenzia sp. THAF191b]|nr:hypothetical protein FIV06_30445 [Labrenzia sp. THAF191b]QFT07997.1 hypothetical protein FIV05_29895 [Labrenzia sp. THAF191a]QFT19638.1 hypothetical protein FIV03_30400 [Labrenzia sp. THAF187b]
MAIHAEEILRTKERMTPKESLEWGLVDRILSKRDLDG